jgi:amino acid adenylation domain-containing protein
MKRTLSPLFYKKTTSLAETLGLKTEAIWAALWYIVLDHLSQNDEPRIILDWHSGSLQIPALSPQTEFSSLAAILQTSSLVTYGSFSLKGEISAKLVVQNGTTIEIHLEGSEPQADSLVAALVEVCDQATANKDKAILDFNLVSPDDKKLTQSWGYHAEQTQPNGTIQDEWTRVLRDSSQCIAIEENNLSLSYGELWARSIAFSNYLKNLGVKKGDPVVISMSRSMDMLVAIHGVMMSGAAYVPVEPHVPDERKMSMVNITKAQLGIVDATAPAIPNLTNIVFSPEVQISLASTHPPVDLSPDDLAYIIFTSGSTGQPKGVAITHGSLMNLLVDHETRYPISEGAFLFKTSFSFDVSIPEIFQSLLSGARTVILPNEKEKDPVCIAEYVHQHRISHINFVPSMFGYFLDWIESEGLAGIASLKYIILAGEEFLPQHAQRFSNVSPSGTQLENLYGPTEATVYSSYFSLSQWSGGSVVPIGQPIRGTKLRVLNRYKKEVPVGFSGELYIGGLGLAKGYFNSPDLTNDKFITVDHSRYYKTGDRARWRLNGQLEMLGRLDSQVKVNGFRVELSEIEFRLNQITKLTGSKVLATKDENGDSLLLAYYTTHSPVEPSEMRVHLETHLPKYMLPHRYIQLTEFPRLSSGKINVAALSGTQEEKAAPTDNSRIGRVKNICAEALKLPLQHLQDDANLLALGAHSLSLLSIISRIRSAFGVSVPYSYLFTHPRPTEILHYIDSQDIPSNFRADFTTSRGSRASRQPATHAQCFFWNMHASQKEDSGRFNVRLMTEVPKSCKTSDVNVALGRLMKIHDILRSQFKFEDGRLWNLMSLADIPPLTELIMTKSQAEQRFQTRAPRSFHLEQSPLFHLDVIHTLEGQTCFDLEMSHLISDGVSVRRFMKQLLEMIFNDTEVEPISSGAPSISPKLLHDGQSFWKNELKDYKVATFDFDGRSGLQETTSQNLKISLSFTDRMRLRQFAVENQVLPFSVFWFILGALIAQDSAQEDLTIVQPVYVHPDNLGDAAIGLFLNSIFLRHRFDPKLPISEQIRSMQKKLLKTTEMACIDMSPFAVQSNLQGGWPTAMINYFSDDDLLIQGRNEAFTVRTYEPAHIPAKVPFSLYIFDSKNEIALNFVTAPGHYSEDKVQRISRNFLRLLATVVSVPNINLLAARDVLKASNTLLQSQTEDVTEALDLFHEY